MHMKAERVMGVLDRAMIGLALFLVLLLVGVQLAHAAEIIPAVGLTRGVNDEGNSKVFGNLAFRAPLLPVLTTEIGVGYRTEDRFADQLKVSMIPVTASLWLTPIPALYAGGGVGWYNMRFDYADAVPLADETRQEFGVHLGGGVKVPLAPSLALDLGGRYVMMREQDSHLVPEKFDPDFWTTTLGLAIKF